MAAHAQQTVEQVALDHGWRRYPSSRSDNVWVRGVSRMHLGYSQTGRALNVGLFYPEGCGTGYIDDPTPVHSAGGRGRSRLEDVLGWLATEPNWARHLVVIPCAARKLDRATSARKLYDSDHFRLALRAAEARAAAVGAHAMILSARHGLLTLDDHIDPYDVTMGQVGAVDGAWVAGQLQALGVNAIEAYVPQRYLAVLREAVELRADAGRAVELVDRFNGARGIGDQRAVLSATARGIGLSREHRDNDACPRPA
ncbi:hypothetical protein A5768_25790 [Mycolicibacterium fortuitum]|nr:hypothetical protein A5768_25790 [Mycolicibacterium fortuitum]